LAAWEVYNERAGGDVGALDEEPESEDELAPEPEPIEVAATAPAPPARHFGPALSPPPPPPKRAKAKLPDSFDEWEEDEEEKTVLFNINDVLDADEASVLIDES